MFFDGDDGHVVVDDGGSDGGDDDGDENAPGECEDASHWYF